MTRIRFDGCDLSPRRSRAPRFAERTRLGALAVVLALLLGACGGGGGRMSQTAYEQHVNDAGRELSTVFGELQSIPGLPAQQAVRIDRARKLLDHVTDGLAGVKPPAKAEDAHVQLVAGLRTISADLRTLAKAARAGKPKAIARARAKLSGADAAQRVIRAIQELQREGFNVNRG